MKTFIWNLLDDSQIEWLDKRINEFYKDKKGYPFIEIKKFPEKTIYFYLWGKEVVAYGIVKDIIELSTEKGLYYVGYSLMYIDERIEKDRFKVYFNSDYNLDDNKFYNQEIEFYFEPEGRDSMTIKIKNLPDNTIPFILTYGMKKINSSIFEMYKNLIDKVFCKIS